MTRTSYILISLLIITLASIGYLSYFSPVQTTLPTLKDNVQKDKTYTEGTLSLAPASQTITAGQTATIDIFLKTQNVTPIVLQFEIGYDPLLVTPTAIRPRGYFTDPIVLINTINPRNGRISYAVKCSAEYKNDSNTSCKNNSAKPVAQIVFTLNPLAVAQEISFNIMPKTLLETKETSEVILKTSNAKVVIQQAAIPLASPSATISQ